MDGTRDGLGAMDGEWWTLGEASERANVSHMALQVWINSGQLTCDLALREGVSVRVVRSLEVAALVPGLLPEVPADGTASKERDSHEGEAHSILGSDAPHEAAVPLAIEAGEESHEAELRREVTRLRKEVLELRAARMAAEIRGEGPRTIRSVSGGAAASTPAGTSARPAGSSRVPPLRAAAFGLALGLVASAGVSQFDRSVVEAADPPVQVDLGLPIANLLEARTAPSTMSPDVSVSEGRAPFSPRRIEQGVSARPPARGGDIVPETHAPTLFPVTLREVDATGYVDSGGSGPACAFHVLWVDGGERYRSALGPCFGSHNAEGLVQGSHRVDGAACCAHHAFVERMTGATRNEQALGQLVAEAEASRAEGVVPPLMRLRAERSARRFLGHALLAHAGLSSWAAAGLDGDAGEHVWALDPAGDPMRLTLRSWVVPQEGDVPMRFELDLRMDDGAEGDEALAFRWLER